MVLMMTFVRHFLAGGFLPECFPGFSVERHDHELMFLGGLVGGSGASAAAATTFTARATFALLLCGQNWSGNSRWDFSAFLAGRDCGLDKNLVAPNNRRACASARNLDLPFYILGGAPFHWRIGFWTFAGAERAPPFAPVLFEIGRAHV